MTDYARFLNPDVVKLRPSGIRKFFDIAETMEDVVSLGVGEPDFATPWHIRQAAIQSIEDRKTRYTANRGLKELRCEIAAYMKRRFGLSYDPVTDVLVSVGGSEAIDAAMRALVCPGDEVILPQPSFVCYEPIIRMVGGTPVMIETKEENEFRLTAEELEAAITEKTRLLIMPYPCNPTGAVMERKDLEPIARIVRERDLFVLSDEIYAELTYGVDHTSIAALDGMQERCVVVNGFSKTYSMTGWRLGYACGPAAVLSQMTKIHQFAIMSAPTTAQYAAIEALRHGDADIRKMLSQYDARRRILVDGFRRIGMDCFEPKGAFYAFPSIRCSGMSSEEFCEKLLYSQHVAIIPGTAFGACGEGFVRASYCYSVSHIKEALARIETFLKEIRA